MLRSIKINEKERKEKRHGDTETGLLLHLVGVSLSHDHKSPFIILIDVAEDISRYLWFICGINFQRKIYAGIYKTSAFQEDAAPNRLL